MGRGVWIAAGRTHGICTLVHTVEWTGRDLYIGYVDVNIIPLYTELPGPPDQLHSGHITSGGQSTLETRPLWMVWLDASNGPRSNGDGRSFGRRLYLRTIVQLMHPSAIEQASNAVLAGPNGASLPAKLHQYRPSLSTSTVARLPIFIIATSVMT